MTFEEGFRLDKYRKIADINMRKNVYLVQHVETNRIFVRKEQKIYCREVYEYLKTWNNPHIPKIFECIEGEDTLILIEEYIQGESLAEHLKEKGVYSQEEVCCFVITICDVLERLHQLPQPIIHGDLKAENIIIQENGILKIINFNTVNDGENEKEFAKGIMGNQKYASPEQFGYSQSEVRADIYSLGVMMNYLLTNKYPDEYLFDYEREEKISLSYIIGKCIEISPDGRYENVTDLRQDLQALSGKTEKKGMWYLPFLPPGFRTGRVWKMIVGLMGYTFIFWCCCTTDFLDPDGIAMTGFYLWANRLTFLLWWLLTVALYANYLGVQKHLPFMQGKYLRWAGYLLWPIIFLFLLAFILVMIGG